MSTTAINATQAGAAQAGASAPAAVSPINELANQNVFLQLLVAQLKNQDPQNPADGTQFVTQLAQFSELSNTTQMAADIAAIRAALTSTNKTSNNSSSGEIHG